VGAEAEVRGRENVEQGEAQGELEDALDAGLRRVGFGVDVHSFSVSVWGEGVRERWIEQIVLLHEKQVLFEDDNKKNNGNSNRTSRSFAMLRACDFLIE